jgi:hypothetical protein
MPTTAEQREHDESFRVLFAIEDLAEDVLWDSTSGLPKDPDDAADELRSRMSDVFTTARTAARTQGASRLRSEYEVVSRYARTQGYRSGPLARLRSAMTSDVEEAGKWADDIARLVRKRASKSDVRNAILRSKAKLNASARAVVADAWADERNRLLSATAAQQKQADIVPFVGKLWDARWDRRTCPRCESLDGTIRPIGLDFPRGEVPGKSHIGCRCSGVLIFAPILTGISDQEAA